MYNKWPIYIPNGHKIYQHLSLQDTPKFTQSWIFGLKSYDLTLYAMYTAKPRKKLRIRKEVF
jgi:hypothetical protein